MMGHLSRRTVKTMDNIYRQRFTAYGWVGVILFLVCSISTFLLLSSRNPNEFIMFVSVIGGLMSPALMLVGREYYQVKTKDEGTSDSDDNITDKPIGIFYPGQPVR